MTLKQQIEYWVTTAKKWFEYCWRYFRRRKKLPLLFIFLSSRFRKRSKSISCEGNRKDTAKGT